MLAQQTQHTPAELHLAEKLQPIRLALKIAESLLARGVSTRDTVSQALDVTERYCKERVYFDVSSNVITASQYRGLYKDPLTLMMTVHYTGSNNLVVQELQQLVRDIVAGLPFPQAIERYKSIEKNGKTYPTWLRTIGNAGMATGIVMLFTDSPTNIFLTFAAACIVDVFMRLIERRRIPPFFVQALAAVAIVFIASCLSALGKWSARPLGAVNPTLITVGGIMVLVAGLSLAATAQDAIDEYYVTASARLVKTAMMTVGIIMGIIISLTIMNEFMQVAIITEKSPPLSPYVVQIIGAAIAGGAWALYTQSAKSAIFWAAVISAGGYAIYVLLSPTGTAIASGVASFCIGFLAAIVARFGRFPSISIINAAIIILVPGYMLYRGLMHFVGDTGPDEFVTGLRTVISALTIALAISAGAALGTYTGRPVRSHIVRLYKYVPQLLTIRRRKHVK